MNRHTTADPGSHRLVGLALVLVGFTLVVYGPSLSLPFMGDDYVFLEETRSKTFGELWSRSNIAFHWYRPWSRELHFWALQRVAGLHEVAFRTTDAVVWVATLCLYAEVARRLASFRVAAIAALGAAALALWGTPLLWISGSQDLWMLFFAMAGLLLFVNGRIGWTAVPFGLALLSKETAAVFPAIVAAYAKLIERRTAVAAVRRTAHLWVMMFVWLGLHPTVSRRLTDPTWQRTIETAHRHTAAGTLLRTALSVVNLGQIPRPTEVGTAWTTLVGCVLVMLAGTAWLVVYLPQEGVVSRDHRNRLLQFGTLWTAAGWFPLLLPSIGWHAYYGCLGALGAWLCLALWLQDRPSVALATVVLLAILQWADANTLSWDWGSEWYQRRAGRITEAIRARVVQSHPTFPHYSRVYFGHLPNNIGLVAGQSPALRVWYGDSTLEAGFYSYYRPRTSSEPPGPDYFFHFDSSAGVVEVTPGPEDLPHALAADPNWEANHDALAMLFLHSRDTPRAAREFEKISNLASRPDADCLAGVCWAAAGDSVRAESLFRVAQLRSRISDEQLHAWVSRLRATFPTGPP